jgi:hypothetical protein
VTSTKLVLQEDFNLTKGGNEYAAAKKRSVERLNADDSGGLIEYKMGGRRECTNENSTMANNTK